MNALQELITTTFYNFHSIIVVGEFNRFKICDLTIFSKTPSHTES